MMLSSLSGKFLDDYRKHANQISIDDLAYHFIKKNKAEFLARYSFSIYENDQDEHAITPEILGYIFENQLSDNKIKGTYYTPPEIARYMCSEALNKYLSDKKDIVKALREVKICDPAIGSGAFAIGMLLEIIDLMKKHNVVISKKEIIENSIYGMDIEKDAVEVAKLRLQLSVFADQEDISDLPSIDFKMLTGDSLLHSFQEEFDIVIGNPPYVPMQANKGLLANLYTDRGFETFSRTGDVYMLFFEKGFSMLKKNGVLAYITSSQWQRTQYGKLLKDHLLKYNPYRIVQSGAGLFETATIDTTILFATKENFQNNLQGGWNGLSTSDLELKNKIEKEGKQLKDWNIRINRGLLTGLNEAFIIDAATKEKLINEDAKSSEIIKPVLRGREIQKNHTGRYESFIINTHNGSKSAGIKRIDVDEYPAIKKHLDQFKEKLITRADQGDTPYNLRSCKYLAEFSKPKIVWKRIGSDLRFTYIEDEVYTLDSTCIMTGEKLNYLLEYLNSDLCKYQLEKLQPAQRTGVGDLLVSVQAVEGLYVQYPL